MFDGLHCLHSIGQVDIAPRRCLEHWIDAYKGQALASAPRLIVIRMDFHHGRNTQKRKVWHRRDG